MVVLVASDVVVLVCTTDTVVLVPSGEDPAEV
jgi:hypothetical protein